MKKTDELEKKLMAAGDAARDTDLSSDAIQATRQRVAAILESKTDVVPASGWPLQSGWGWAVAASLCVAAVFAVLSHRPDGPAASPGTGGTVGVVSAAEIDLEISRIQKSLDYKISQLQARQVGVTIKPNFESRSRSVRDRIQMCASMINAELPEGRTFERRNRLTL